MKQYVLVAFSIIVLCGLSLPIALVSADYPGYETINYQALDAPVEDGTWTTDTEWDDAMTPPNLPATFHWRQKWTWPSNIFEHFLIEFFADATNDTGDYFQLCVDNMADGGTAPQPDDIRIDWVGHDVTGLTLYQGDGTGWVEFNDYTWDTDIYIAESLSSSPLDSNPHWIIELRMDRSKSEFDVSGAGYAPRIRLVVYDESNSEAGVQAWPPTSRDVPNDWGVETGTTENIPEPMTIVTVVVLSSVAIVVSGHFLRRRLKTENPSAVKTG